MAATSLASSAMARGHVGSTPRDPPTTRLKRGYRAAASPKTPPTASSGSCSSKRASMAIFGVSQRLSHDIPPSLPSRLGAEVPVQGADRRCAAQGPRDHAAGLRRNGRDHRQRRAVTRSRAHVRRDTAARLGQRLRPPREGALVPQDQQEFEHIRRRYWGQRFWQRGYFSTTSGNIIDDIIMRYLNRHTHKDGFSPSA